MSAIELAALAVVAPAFAFGLWAYWRIMGTRAMVMVLGFAALIALGVIAGPKP